MVPQTIIGLGKSYFVGENKKDCVKLDLYYTDSFIEDLLEIEKIRLATIQEVIAMKMNVISRGGRKKDFWDIHELITKYSMDDMLDLHKKRYPHEHDSKLIRSNFTTFVNADVDFNPICLKDKHWEIIKLDLIEFANC